MARTPDVTVLPTLCNMHFSGPRLQVVQDWVACQQVDIQAQSHHHVDAQGGRINKFNIIKQSKVCLNTSELVPILPVAQITLLSSMPVLLVWLMQVCSSGKQVMSSMAPNLRPALVQIFLESWILVARLRSDVHCQGPD